MSSVDDSGTRIRARLESSQQLVVGIRQLRTNYTLYVVQPPSFNPRNGLCSIPAHVRLSLPRRVQHRFRSLQRHIRHAEDLVPKIFKAVRGVVVVPLPFESKSAVDHQLVVCIDRVV
jgi:hypothetical protein